VPTVPTVSNQSQFNYWWYTGTLSHNPVLLKALLPAKSSTEFCDGVPVYHHE
jgi:hypothetical protein